MRTLANGDTIEFRNNAVVIGGREIETLAMPIAMPSDLKGKVGAQYSHLMLGKYPLTSDEARSVKRQVKAHRQTIMQRVEAARRYNNLMNEGGDGYTPHKF